MGDNKCAYEGCNALEFRTSGYCLRHKDGPKTTLIGEINPLKKEISEEISIINTPKSKHNNYIWFPLGLFAGPAIAIIMVTISEFLLIMDDSGSISVFSICVILPLIYIIGIVWGLRSNGPTGFSLGLLVTPMVFGLFVLFLFYIFEFS